MVENKDYITPEAEKRLLFLRNAMLVEPEVCVEKAKYTTETFRKQKNIQLNTDAQWHWKIY